MKFLRMVLLAVFVVSQWAGISLAAGKIATEEDINILKEALISGRIEVGKTRMKDIQGLYGEPNSISHTEKTAVFDYGDFKIEFDKARYMRDWEYDSSRKPAYTTDVNNLRKDLESDKIPGDMVTFDKIKKDYGAPTQSKRSDKDGEYTTYYYGDIKIKFENYFAVKSWKGKKLEAASSNVSSSGLTSKPATSEKSKVEKSKAEKPKAEDKKVEPAKTPEAPPVVKMEEPATK